VKSRRLVRIVLPGAVLLSMCAVPGGAPPHSIAAGQQPLGVYTAYPHYFTGMDGRPVLFLGHAEVDVVLGLTDDDWRWQLDSSAAAGLNLVKVLGANSRDLHDDRAAHKINPFKRTGPGYDWNGYPKWDLDQFDDEYFANLTEVVSYACSRDIYVQVYLWNEIGLKVGPTENEWDGSYWNPSNTITSTAAYGFPGWGGDGRGVFYGSLSNPVTVNGKTLLERQEELFDRIVAATRDYPNVFYELGLEVSSDSYDTAWADHWIARLRAIAPGKLMIVDTTHNNDRTEYEGVTAHQVSSEGDSVPEGLRASLKMGIEDSDFTCDWAGSDDARARRSAWYAVVSGAHWEDFRCADRLLVNKGTPSIAWKHPAVVDQLKHIRRFFDSRMIPFGDMIPDDSRATGETGAYQADVLAGRGHYVVYAPPGASFDLRLGADGYSTEWYDPRQGTFRAGPRVAGGTVRFSPPTSEDWVLHVYSRPGPLGTLPPGEEVTPTLIE
jgi:hypothetical protein